jgi:antitoxin VapB
LGQQLNIKSEDAYGLATRLSELTGESLTTAVTTAIRERLDREEKLRDREARKQRILAIAAEIRAHMAKPLATSDRSWLCDDNGLPV